MKIPPLLAVALVAITVGCASTGQKMPSDKIAAIKPGQTTRADMVEWFGQPRAVGLDADGRPTATWYYFKYVAAPFYGRARQQMLAARFTTNNILDTFTITDDFQNEPNRTTSGTQRTPDRNVQGRGSGGH